MSEHQPPINSPGFDARLAAAGGKDAVRLKLIGNADDARRLALAGNTNDLINWSKLRSLLAVVPALTDETHCQLLLDVANGKPLKPQQWNQLVGALVLSASNDSTFSADAARVRNISDKLGAFVDASKAQRAAMFAEAQAVAESHTLLAPCESAKGSGERRLIAENVSAGLVHGLYLVFHPKRAAKLRRCQYSECREFFFARPALSKSGVGRPATRYCSPAHLKTGTLEVARTRMQRLRRKRK